MMALLSEEEIASLGFASVGKNVMLSDKASFYNCSKIHLGSNVRVDDFCVISAGSGGIYIGNYIHIAAFSSLIGAERIQIDDFSNISSRVSIYSSSDDYSGNTLTNPLIPEEFKDVAYKPVILKKHVIVGCGSVILPGSRLSEGVAVGALSLVNSDCDSFSIYAGIPAKKIKNRNDKLLELENKFTNSINNLK